MVSVQDQSGSGDSLPDPFFSVPGNANWNAFIGRQGDPVFYAEGYIEAALELAKLIIREKLYPLRVHLQDMDFTAQTVQRLSAPANTGTKHLGQTELQRPAPDGFVGDVDTAFSEESSTSRNSAETGNRARRHTG